MPLVPWRGDRDQEEGEPQTQIAEQHGWWSTEGSWAREESEEGRGGPGLTLWAPPGRSRRLK